MDDKLANKDSKTSDSSKLRDDIKEAGDYVLSKTKHRAKLAVICGSGLNHFYEVLTEADKVDYKDIPHFVSPTVQGHAGRLMVGLCNGVPVILVLGRIHAYEGHHMWKVTFAARTLAQIGIQVLIVTNAAGGLNESFCVGDFMIIKDHINLPALAGLNPLVGLNDERFGCRFLDMSTPYDRELREIGRRVAKDLNMNFIREGVHSFQVGPMYETTAECRMMKLLGADTVGMSTAPEVIVARQHGIRCFGLSMVTNLCNLDFDVDHGANHDEVLEAGNYRAKDIRRFCSALILEISKILESATDS